MERKAVVDKIKEEAQVLKPQVQVIMYGSEARGNARLDSDIDLLFLVDKEKLSYGDKEKLMAPFYDIELSSGIIIPTMIIPKKEWENRPFSTPFQQNVLKEGIVL